MNRCRLIVVTLLLPCYASLALGQGPPPDKQPRRTPLGTQVTKPTFGDLVRKSSPKTTTAKAPVELPQQALDRAANAHGGAQRLSSVVDSTMDGTLTYYSIAGPKATYPVKVYSKDGTRAQRLITTPVGERRQGTDGQQTWDEVLGHNIPAVGETLHFLETQTNRRPNGAFNYQSRGARLHDLGKDNTGQDRTIAIEERSGRTTNYVLDGASGRISRLEFTSGQTRNMFTGKMTPITESFVYSNYRMVDGVLTPFKIEHFSGGVKVDEMNFDIVRHNASVKNDQFRP